MITACGVKFQREFHGEWETGIAILLSPTAEEAHLILDDEGEQVTPNDYQLKPELGCFTLQGFSKKTVKTIHSLLTTVGGILEGKS